MIPFLDLKLINAPYEIAFQNKLKSVLESGWFILGEVKNLNLISQLIAKLNIV
jgi:ribosomal protein L30E